MFYVVEAIVDVELEFGYDAQLFSHTCAEVVAHLSLVCVDVLHYLFGLLAGEDAEIGAALAQVGADAAGADADQYATHATCLLLEDVAQLLLYEACYLVLSCCFHRLFLMYSVWCLWFLSGFVFHTAAEGSENA